MSTQSAVFHEGEIAIQKRLGVFERMDKFARKVVRDFMPEQHQTFYKQLPMLFLGYQDNNDRVWASVVAGEPGFVQASNAKALSVSVKPFKGDPLERLLSESASAESTWPAPLRLGVLGIELETRRRNRMSAKLAQVTDSGFSLDVLQAFGNCPQYIQTRKIVPIDTSGVAQDKQEFTSFDNALSQFIHHADTFFVASSSRQSGLDKMDATHGADVSHRGGRPGFVNVVDDTTLIIPDYMGNNHFNTLGNFEVNPSAGLLFLDFDTGDIITMTGTADVLWDEQDQEHFKGAERFWTFTLTKGYRLKAAMPFRFEFEQWSANTQMTGTWIEAEANKNKHALQDLWHDWRVSKKVKESDSITSFYFEPTKGSVPDFSAGQFLTVKATLAGKEVVRNYSVSSSPLDTFIRISVKRDGVFSNWLHDELQAGETLQIKWPAGGFTLVENSDKPAVLLSAGVGITPMVSMLRHIVKDNVRTRSNRNVVMLNTFRQASDQAFFDEINGLVQHAGNETQAFWLLTQPESTAKPGTHFSAKGRITPEVLQAILPLGIYEFYLCGPTQFMQDTYDMLLDLGVQDSDIFAEAFGPAGLQRKPVAQTAEEKGDKPAAESALVRFSQSSVEQVWNKDDGTLLEFAEAHGMTPAFSCRNGSCGTCKVHVKQGQVTHNGSNTFPVNDEEALLCCARPAHVDGAEVIEITLDT